MKTYHYNGKDYTELPDPFLGGSPMTDARFIALGGTITDDGELSPVEVFKTGIENYLETLEEQMADLGIVITIAEFKEAARTKMSTQLIEWAKNKHVPEEVITTVRQKMLELIADASRLGLTWDDIFKED